MFNFSPIYIMAMQYAPFKNISLHIRMNEAIGIVSIIKQIRKKSGTQNREMF